MNTYLEKLTGKGVQVPDCYKEFLESEEFSDYSGMVLADLDKEMFSETTQIHFDWDDYMTEELYSADLPDLIPIAILHDTEIVEDIYFAIRTGDENCAVLFCEIDDESGEVGVEEYAPSLTGFLEKLEDPEDNYIHYLETKFKATIPDRYKNFLQSYEYVEYTGKVKCDDNEVLFDEFPHLQWAAEEYNNGQLEWLPIGSLGEDHNEYDDVLVIKMGDENCPVFMINSDERIMISNTLNEFLN